MLTLCGILFLVHFAWAFGRSNFYDASQPGTYWLDDHNYYKEAAAIAAAWKSGEYPDFWLKGSPPYLGTLHVGYHRPLATLFYVFGPATFWGLLLNAMCAACLPIFAALSSRYLWSKSLSDFDRPGADFGLIAAIFVACHPSQFYWASFLMKDMYTAFVALAAITLILGTYRRRSISMGVGAAMVLPHLFTVRAYTALSIFAGTLMLPLMGLSRKVVIRTAGVGIATLVIICLYTTAGNAFYRQLRDSFVALAPPGLENPMDLIIQMLTGIPRLFLAPYAWLILNEPSPMYGMYPGMWFLYLVGYPAGFAGLYAAVKNDVKPAVVPLTVFGLSSLVFLSAIYQGDASRQRFYLEYLMLIFAAYGWRNFSKPWAIAILALETAFAVGQVLSLR